MIGRLWRCQVNPTKMKEYEVFETNETLPMLLRQPGFVAVLFGRTQKDCTAITLWNNVRDIEALAKSETFIATAKKLESSGLLRGDQNVEIVQIVGGYLPAANTERPLDAYR